MKKTLIPVELCEYVLKNKIDKPFQLYILLKSLSSGMIKIDVADRNKIAKLLEYESERAVRNNLKKLLLLNFIGFDIKSKFYFVRGYNALLTDLGMESVTGAWFNLDDLDKLQAFCMAAVTCYIVNSKKSALRRIKKREKMAWVQEREKGRSLQSIHAKLPSTVSTTYLQKKLGISLASAHKWKSDAHKAGFMTVKHNLKPLNQPATAQRIILRGNPELRPILRVKGKKLYIQLADTITPNIIFKPRKKNEKRKKGFRENNTALANNNNTARKRYLKQYRANCR